MLGQRIDELAHDVLYIHPALPEVLEQGLLELASRGPRSDPRDSACQRRRPERRVQPDTAPR